MTNKTEVAREKLSVIVMPMLVGIIGWFLVGTLKEISGDIKQLKQANIDRDIWVRDWIETWQPTLDWARAEKEYHSKYGGHKHNIRD